ncbi:MAG: DUF4129 domain-containing protein [Deferrisomatales bacterium]|nr:DUF4129 domain-containing protein [Deferrisomatales bacterium]
MTRRDAAVSLGMRAGMELCWRYAWAAITVQALTGRPFPLVQGAGALAAAAVLTRRGQGRGWPVIGVVFVHAAGFALAGLLLVHRVYDPALPWWDLAWTGALLRAPRTAEEVLGLLVVLLWAILFWAGGVGLARRPADYLAVCTRFDIGVAAFLGLFLVRWVAHAQAGVEMGGPSSEGLLLPYFTFGLFSIGLARNRGHGRKDFLAGPRGLGLVLGGLISALLVGVAVAVLFRPFLTAAAEAGYDVLRTVATPLGPVVLRVLRFLLVGRSSGPGGPTDAGGVPGSAGTATPPAHTGGWEALLGQLFGWGLFGLLTAGGLAAAAGVVWYLCRRLFSRTRLDPSRPGLWAQLRLDLSALRKALAAWAARWLGPSPNRGAVACYAALRRWGTRSGIAPMATETPLEYSVRLQRRFPSVGGEITELVGLFHREVYAEQQWDRACLAVGRRARARLRSPRLWPSRLRSWLLRSDPVQRHGS